MHLPFCICITLKATCSYKDDLTDCNVKNVLETVNIQNFKQQ